MGDTMAMDASAMSTVVRVFGSQPELLAALAELGGPVTWVAATVAVVVVGTEAGKITYKYMVAESDPVHHCAMDGVNPNGGYPNPRTLGGAGKGNKVLGPSVPGPAAGHDYIEPEVQADNAADDAVSVPDPPTTITGGPGGGGNSDDPDDSNNYRCKVCTLDVRTVRSCGWGARCPRTRTFGTR
jgi:hypothetical protein